MQLETEKRNRLADDLHEYIQQNIENSLDYKDYIQNKENLPERAKHLATIDWNIDSLRDYSDMAECIRKRSDTYLWNMIKSIVEARYTFLTGYKESLETYAQNKIAREAAEKDMAAKLARMSEGMRATAMKRINASKEITEMNLKYIHDGYIDVFQTFNKLILTFLSVLDLQTLSPDAKKMIRLCPSLWSKIQNPSSDLGNPEEAFEMQIFARYHLIIFHLYGPTWEMKSLALAEGLIVHLFGKAKQ